MAEAEGNAVQPAMMLSAEQFARLLQEIRPQPARDNQPPANQGNFVHCTTRFDGSQTSNVEAFINAIQVYKDCANVSEENALKGLPMLLTGNAATWWQGIKSEADTFDAATNLLRHNFSVRKPAYKIYREIFACEQDKNTRTDNFVSKIRALFAQLPAPALTENVQLDMIYGLLNRQIRERVPRDKITTFSELLTESRYVEETLDEIKNCKSEHFQIGPDKRTRCTNCRNVDHDVTSCRKLEKSRIVDDSSGSRNSNNSKDVDTKPKITCYGCGAPGVIKSNCMKCKVKVENTGVSSIGFYSIESERIELIPRSRPILHVEIADTQGRGYVDTGAKQSVAGHTLVELLHQKGIPFREIVSSITLADGHTRTEKIKLVQVDVKIKDKAVPTTFVCLPNRNQNATLLGMDFLEAARIVLHIPDKKWYFADNNAVRFDLITEDDPEADIVALSLVTDQRSEVLSLRKDEGQALEKDQTKQLSNMIQKHEAVFATTGEPTKYAEHRIETGDHAPISHPPYRMPNFKKKILKAKIEQLLEEGIIEPCESPWSFPIVLVQKEVGKDWRLCVDYRSLNAITTSDKYPLPRIDDLLHGTGGNVFMSTMDLRAGYHQVPMRAEDRDKTAFTCPFGTFRYNCMPFGLKNAGATFQRLIDRFRAGLPDVCMFAYLDDLIIVSSSFEKHLQDLNQVFDRLKLFGLRAKREKCVFSRESVRFLGHIVSSDGLRTDPAKVSAISDLPIPRNLKEVRSFLQTASWYRRFINNFSAIAKPLSDLTKKNEKWTWKAEQRAAFDSLKNALTTAPILRQANESMDFVIRTDASDYALGAVLLQGEGNDERPVEYASRLLTPSERNYSTTEREALAVVWALNKFRGYIDGAEVHVESDHQALRWLMSLKSPSGRLARWALAIQSYSPKMDYVQGRRNVVADSLSRPPRPDDENIDAESPGNCDISSITVNFPNKSSAQVREEQLSDPEIEKVINCFETANHPDLPNWLARGYIMSSGVLYRYVPEEDTEEPQLVIPKGLRKEIMTEFHDAANAGHYGVKKTLDRISSRFFWPGMRKYVTEYVRGCVKCQRYKALNTKPEGLLKTPVANQRFEVISIDLFGPLPSTEDGYSFIFIVEDTATKWVELFPLVRATAEACARVLIDEVFLRYGTPRRVISDNGVQFVSNVMQSVCSVMNIEQCLVPYYHPEANPVERKNRDLKTQLSILVGEDHKSWKDDLPSIRFAMNTARCESTGQSSAFLTFGRELRTVGDVNRDFRAIIQEENFVPQITPYLLRMADVMKDVREVHENKQDTRKHHADKRRQCPSNYESGDLVLVKTHVLSNAAQGKTSKFVPKRDGPYRIFRKKSSTTFEIARTEDPDTPIGCFHVSDITPFRGKGDEVIRPVIPIRKRGRPRKQEHARGRSHTPEGESVAHATAR